jgi:peptidoglycan L-alanyl-D-glutamate endopeptidase CwlK
MGKFKLSSRSEQRLEGVLPILPIVIKKALEHPDCPDDFGIPQYGGLRTTEDQQELYAKGRTDFSTHQRPVTYVDGVNKKSNHQAKEDGFGYAFDIYIYCHKTKRASWNVDRLTAVANHLIKVAAINNVDLQWGGHWNSFKDYPHFESKGFLNGKQ